MKIARLIGGLALLLCLTNPTAFAGRHHAEENHDGKVFYTQHNMWIYKDTSFTANYAVDTMVPVNTKVSVVSEGRNRMVLALSEGGTQFTVSASKREGENALNKLKSHLLGQAPVDLTKFSKVAQEAIKRGEVKRGMTRTEVLAARGYPPEQSTLSLDSDAWHYQQSKWDSIIVHFSDGKVTDIQD